MANKKLTRSQVGQLGGLTAAHNMTPEARERRARAGGDAALEKNGRAHFIRMNHIRWGRLEGDGKSSA